MFKFLKSMSWYIKKNWYRYILVLFFGLVGTFLNLLPTWIIGNLTAAIDKGELTEDFLIYEILIPFVCVVVAIYVNQLIRRTCMNFLTTNIYYNLQDRYMKSILSQDAEFFERFQSGDLLVRAIGDIKTVKFSAGNRLLNIFVEIINVIAAFVMLILIDPLLAVCCFIPLTSILVTNLILKSKVKENWKRVREKTSEMGNVVLESITNVKTVRAYSKEEDTYKKNLKYSQETYEVEKKNLKINVIFQPLFQFIVSISTLICFCLGAYFYYIGRITELADLVKFSMYLGLFQTPLTNIGNMINNFYQSLISADRLNEVYDSKSKIVETENPIEGEISTIEFKNFTFNFPGDEYSSLYDINLKINKGETIGIVGKTGSGKSSLVKQLMRQLPTNPNQLFINGKPIEEYDKEAIRTHMAYVPQEHVLFSRSVYDNVALGSEEPSEDDIKLAVKLADFEKDVDDLNDGLNTLVGEYGVTLSGGQKQRLGIARALLRNSDILILDDSLSAVDGNTEANIISTLNEYRKNKTNIIVCHRLSAVRHANNIIVLDKGRIIEEGTHDELMSRKGWYYEQYISQQMEVTS